MAFLVVEKGSEEMMGRAFHIGEKPLTIGYPTPDNKPDIPIFNDYVSRQHAKICFCGDSFTICDLGSKNGTEIGGRLIRSNEQYQLKENTVIGLAVINGEPQVKLRFKTSIGTQGPPSNFHHHGININEDKKEVFINGKLIQLTKSEYELLLLLYMRKGVVCSRDDIISAVSKWSSAIDPGTITNAQIDIMVHRLREKVEQDPSNPRIIVSVRTFGYKLIFVDKEDSS